MNDSLLTGVVLIVAGVALGLIAYAVLLNRREVTPSDSEELPAQREEPSPPAPPEPPAPAERRPPTAPPPAAWAGGPAAPVTPIAPAARMGPAPVAALLRDEAGELRVRVGEHEYRDPSELRTSLDWARLESALADLQRWMGLAKQAERAKDAPTLEPGRPGSMVQQINTILVRKLAETGRPSVGVRLVESAGGEVQVYVGLERYPMDAVPDAEVRKLIREAVAEWEARP